jgi:hypothetical protein
MVTFSNTQAASVPSWWLVTASPTVMVGAIAIDDVGPSFFQLLPSPQKYAVNRSRARTTRSH